MRILRKLAYWVGQLLKLGARLVTAGLDLIRQLRLARSGGGEPVEVAPTPA